MTKCRELNAELVANTAKVCHTFKGHHQPLRQVESVKERQASGAEETSVDSLQKELEVAWQLVEKSRNNETTLKDEVSSLKVVDHDHAGH